MSPALGVTTPAPTASAAVGERPIWGAVAAQLSEALFGEFEILGELGEGGMAAVFLAHEFALNRRVALKVMSPALMMGEGMVERFRQEAVTQANLQHANIVGVHGVRTVGDLHFFVMQFVPGRTLQQVLRKELTEGRLLAIPVVQAILFETGSALMFAHRRGVIHRDIKPGNILLNADGDAVVTDFGIAKVAEAPSQTMTGTVVGTPTYMSPEQCYAIELTPASDQYSLGVVAYELITGRPPFSGTSFVVMAAHTRDDPPPITAFRPDCPPEIAAAIMRMLAKKHEDRFADLSDALAALGAKAPGMRDDDPLRRELRRLADAQGVQAKLADLLRYPLSPAPRSKPSAPSLGARTGDEAATEGGANTPAPSTLSRTAGGSGARAATDPNRSGPRTAPSQESAPLSATQVLSGDAIDSGARASIGRGADARVEHVAPSPNGEDGMRRRLMMSAMALAVVAAAGGIWLAMRPGTSTPDKAASTVATDSAGVGTEGSAAPGPSVATVDSGTTAPGSGAAPTEGPPTPASEPSTGATTALRPRIRIDGAAAMSVGEGRPFAALLVGNDGSPVGRAVVRWSSSAPAVARVDPRTGEVQALSAGTATISARGADGSASLAVAVAGKAGATSQVAAAPNAEPTRPVREPPPRESPTPSSAAAQPAAAPAQPAELSAQELTSQAERTLASYGEALSSRDTTRIRRAFPNISAQLLGQWQSMFDATSQVKVAVTDVEAVDALSVTPGSTSHFRVTQLVTFNVSGNRKQQSQKTTYTATLRREGSGWVLAGLSDR